MSARDISHIKILRISYDIVLQLNLPMTSTRASGRFVPITGVRDGSLECCPASRPVIVGWSVRGPAVRPVVVRPGATHGSDGGFPNVISSGRPGASFRYYARRSYKSSATWSFYVITEKVLTKKLFLLLDSLLAQINANLCFFYLFFFCLFFLKKEIWNITAAVYQLFRLKSWKTQTR